MQGGLVTHAGRSPGLSKGRRSRHGGRATAGRAICDDPSHLVQQSRGSPPKIVEGRSQMSVGPLRFTVAGTAPDWSLASWITGEFRMSIIEWASRSALETRNSTLTPLVFPFHPGRQGPTREPAACTKESGMSSDNVGTGRQKANPERGRRRDAEGDTTVTDGLQCDVFPSGPGAYPVSGWTVNLWYELKKQGSGIWAVPYAGTEATRPCLL